MVNVAIFVNFLANVFLLIAKVIASVTSSSLSIIASLIDSALDFLSTVIIYTVSRIIAQRDWKNHFPVGKARLEPIGVLVFSVVMIVSFMQVTVEAVQRLLAEEEDHIIVRLSPQAIVIMISTGKNFPAFEARKGN
jgi:divalent metal cation (Fe/Co/Zn/Cd) transporter